MVSLFQDWHYGPVIFKQKIVLDTLISRDKARQKKEGWATSGEKMLHRTGEEENCISHNITKSVRATLGIKFSV